MKLVSWNVNGIRAIYKKNFYDVLRRVKPDILCVQETKAWKEQLEENQCSPLSYQSLFSEADIKGYSGVATYYTAEYEPASEPEYGIEIECFDKEGRFLITDHREFDLYNIYFPSGSAGEKRQQFKYEFLDGLSTFLEGLTRAERRYAIICGDFNICHRPIDIHHPETAEKQEMSGFLPDERAWMDRFVDMGFTDTFRHIHGDIRDQYSWWSFRAAAREKNLGWRIDYIFVGQGLKDSIVDAKLLQKTMGSDHCPVVLELDI